MERVEKNRDDRVERHHKTTYNGQILKGTVMVKFVAKVESSEAAQQPNSDPLMEFVMCLLHARTTAQLKHWMTQSRSDHQALDFFYEGIIPLVDQFVEGFQGQYGKLHSVIDGYKFPTVEPLEYFLALALEIDTKRTATGFPIESWLQNSVDEIRLLTSQTIYQLRELS